MALPFPYAAAAYDPGRNKLFQGTEKWDSLTLANWRSAIGHDRRAQRRLSRRLPPNLSPGELSVASLDAFYYAVGQRVAAWPQIWPIMLQR